MIRTAEAVAQSASSGEMVVYEQPLNERMRTFLRIEYLYQQLQHHIQQSSPWSSRSAVTGMLDIISILIRGDVRSDVLKELERQITLLNSYQAAEQVDAERLNGVLDNLQNLRAQLNAVGPTYLQELRESEFLNAIRHRSTIPGGTCTFDLPDYSHWLRQNFERRSCDMQDWLRVVRPLCESVAELLWLLRQSHQPSDQVAVNGVYHHTLDRNSATVLLRVSLPGGSGLYPEISGGHHRFTLRFMEWSAGDSRPVQAEQDIPFSLATC
jgi:cell division protein ZapD